MNHYRLRIIDKETIEIIRDIGGYENLLENGQDTWANTEEDARLKLVEQNIFSNFGRNRGHLHPSKESYRGLNDIWTNRNKVAIKLI
ncbi:MULTISPECIES: hypothetical protein [Legionella]|uniref:Uncharacterized protein n=1 Tax=Legionella resiliens TaxID=2905958 RepID=A0ABS8X061_9GAMM|nr:MULTISPECIES: hypothetical protein [unclassified Legionella]MCE0721863.1 hypothetical protein [Legionella sp. 9fVS26]MCE3531017.1 hypothetical protein [Legionella sp. 8cVS16]QLZ70579.1 hypothetical protein FOLKNPGA_03393 [Legionella sp. PC1000]